jgi:hypothetical protein
VVAEESFVSRVQIEECMYALGDSMAMCEMVEPASGVDVELSDGELWAPKDDPRLGVGCSDEGERLALL